MTCPLVQREHSVLVLVHLEFLAVRVSRATQHSLRFPLTLPLIYRVSVALHPPLSVHLLVPQHPAPDLSLQQPCQVREQKITIRMGKLKGFSLTVLCVSTLFAFCSWYSSVCSNLNCYIICFWQETRCLPGPLVVSLMVFCTLVWISLAWARTEVTPNLEKQCILCFYSSCCLFF